MSANSHTVLSIVCDVQGFVTVLHKKQSRYTVLLRLLRARLERVGKCQVMFGTVTMFVLERLKRNAFMSG